MKLKNVLFVILFLYGCAKKPHPKDIIRIRLREDPTTLDPAYIVDVAGGAVSAKLFNGLVRFDENTRIIPDLTESWDISKDGLVYSFKLRGNIKFTNGSDLTADSVKKSFERIISESPRKWIFNKVSKIETADDLNLKIILKEPFSPFLSMLSMPNLYISPDGKSGTGPYKLVSWEHDKKIILEQSPRYFGECPKVSGIEYLVIPEEFSAQTEFDLGNLDIMEVSPIQWAGIQKRKRAEIPPQVSHIGLNIYYIGLNCRKPIFKDKRTRQALNYAIDKKAIIKGILFGQAVPASGPIPPDLLKGAVMEYPYLPNKAKKLLGGKIVSRTLKLYVRAQAQAVQIAEAVQYYLNRIGLKVEITPLEWSAFKKAVDNGDADMFIMSWWADYPDPENFIFPTFHSSNFGTGGNRAQFKNKNIDILIEEAQEEMDQAKREVIYERIERYINHQAPWIFLWNTKELYIVQPWIRGFKLYPVYNSDKGTDVYIHN